MPNERVCVCGLRLELRKALWLRREAQNVSGRNGFSMIFFSFFFDLPSTLPMEKTEKTFDNAARSKPRLKSRHPKSAAKHMSHAGQSLPTAAFWQGRFTGEAAETDPSQVSPS